MSKYEYIDISELRSRLLQEIEQYYKCMYYKRNIAEFQSSQFNCMLDNVLAQVELETK